MLKILEIEDEFCRNDINDFFNRVRHTNSEPNKQLMVSLYSLLPDANPMVLDILKEYRVPLENYISLKEISQLLDRYDFVINYCCKYNDYGSERGNTEFSGYTHIPTPLIELCVALAKPMGRVYLPYAGEGIFASYCKNCRIIYGFETDPIAWAFSQIVLSSIRARMVEIEYRGFETHEILEYTQKYDCIFVIPPMMSSNVSKPMVDVIRHFITKQLRDGGEFHAILPISFCNILAGWYDIRKIVRDYRGEYSVRVITLPSMLQPPTLPKVCLVSFFKNGRGEVVLADMTDDKLFAHRNIVESEDYIFKMQSVLDAIRNHDKRYVWTGHVGDLDCNMNMLPSRYLMSQSLPMPNENERYIKVKDLIELMPCKRSIKTDEMQPVIGMKELSSNYLNCNIRHRDIPKIQLKSVGNKISDNALLVGFLGGKFKVGRLVDVNQQQVTLRYDIIPFRVKEDIITEDFFLRAIMSEMSEFQGREMSFGGMGSFRLDKKSFLEIDILVPPLDKQDELCREDARESVTESDRKIMESYEAFRKDVHMKKHAIGQTLAALKNWWTLLDDARKTDNGTIDENAVIGGIYKVSVKDIFENLETTMSKLTTQLNKFDTGNGLVKEEFALTEFIEKYIQDNRHPLFRYVYDSTEHRSLEDTPEIDIDENINDELTGDLVLKKGEPIEYVRFPKEALTIIFNNIISNACAHGFRGIEGENIVRIDITNVGSDYIVSVSNNGKPLDRGMNPEHVTIYGKTSGDTNKHFGIGGYEIKRLMEEFGDNVEIVSDPNAEFTVTYKLIFHDTNIISSF